MASTGAKQHEARGGGRNGKAPRVEEPKSKIKKLTADKIRDNLALISRKNGEIDLTSHGIEAIISLDGLQHATKLMLSHNKLTKLSDLKRVQNITMLKLIDNKLNGEGLAELQHLKKLVILNVAENQIARIPVEVLRNLRTLKALMLNNNSITTLEWLPKFPELNSLIVSHNRISQFLPRTIDRLPALTKISFSHNLLEEIPDLSALTGLTELRLSHNRIKRIPFSLAKLKNLRVLELGNNLIDDWEGIEALGRLENLKQLSLTGNPIVGQALAVDPTKKTKKKKSKSKKKKSSKAKDDGDDSEASSESEDEEDEEDESEDEEDSLTEEEKKQRKEAKKLDAKHKQYNFKMKRIFPKLVIRDGQRILDKKTHGYVAPPKEEKPKKEKKRKHEEKSEKKEKKYKEPVETADEVKEPKEKKRKAVDAESEAKPAKSEAIKSKAEIVAPKTTPEVPVAVAEAPEKKKEKKEKKAKEEKKKKSGGKEEKKKSSQRQPKDMASGVLAVKQFKKPKQDKKDRAVVDISKVNFTPDVGMGGSSAWD